MELIETVYNFFIDEVSPLIRSLTPCYSASTIDRQQAYEQNKLIVETYDEVQEVLQLHFLNEPGIHIDFDFYLNRYSIVVKYDIDNEIVSSFATTDFNKVIRYWNNNIVDEFSKNTKLPEMNSNWKHEE